MRTRRDMHIERRDRLGIVAGVCQERGLAEYLDAVAGPAQQQVSVGTATVAMILHGLGFSNRRLYLGSQFFATKPVEHLLGPGMRAEPAAGTGAGEETGEDDAHLIAVTDGYSREHRADLKQGLLALATTRQGEVPL